MASKFTIHFVNVLPTSGLIPHSFYGVLANAGDTVTEVFLTDASGNAKGVGNTAFIQSVVQPMISSAIGQINAFVVTPDINGRDNLTLTKNEWVVVTDASDDTTVDAGSALYAYDHATTSFSKFSEFESLDITHNWADIVGKPTSTVGDIDDAVGKRHNHTNIAALDKISDNSGDPEYDGNAIVTAGATDW